MSEASDNAAVQRISELEKRNFKLREKMRSLKAEHEQQQAEITRLQGLIPAEGSEILKPEDKALLDTYKALGTPDALKGLQDEVQTVKQTLASREQDDTLREVADKAGCSFKVLKQLGGDLKFEVEEKEGKATVYVGEGDAKKPLDDYAKEQWGEFVPALFPQQQQNSGGQGRKLPAFTPTPDRGSQKGPDVDAIAARKRREYGGI